ncbi:pyridoxal phosphate-dependent decarboxylase family protein [Pseudorhodoferax sp.]|uniref:pyridoxal phosphate-dependent decarboxylase family protein n=1 Tax=Pseudorhodoferax sp. TaxID=1993553 RepID=UPI002DD657F2|nr:aminotransferase class V-fold PLP-dependent enzyme [Pseudorhodoferax sp.]
MKRLPEHGTPWPELQAELREAGRDDVDWRGGRVPMFIHYAGEDVLDVAKAAYMMYFSENGLGLRAFGSLDRFETEVVQMGLALLNGDDRTRGAMTTGGTESIFLAVKAARDQALARDRHITRPQIVMARSAHPAFDKAAHFMGLEAVRTPLAADFRADPEALAAAVTPDTVMLVGSAPAFPHGVVDPIPQIAAVARERGLWLHVDACVGGYIAPFARQLGATFDDWDFSVPGVTSISADLHKYGYAAKGASTLFFRDAKAFGSMGWAFDGWPRGPYFTHTLVGTRGGGAIASAWAVMKYLGAAGYRRITQRVLDTRVALQKGAAELGLQTMGDPQLSILAYGSPAHDFARIGGGLMKRGWIPGLVTGPDGLHHMLNLTHEPVVGTYLADLAAAMDDAGKGRTTVAAQARY